MAAGVYTETFSLRAGVIISGTGAGATIVDGENLRGPLVTAVGSDVTNATVLRDLTIQRGITATFGGGVLITDGAAPTIENCVIRENAAGIDGGGLYILEASPTLKDTQIIGNAAGWEGSGLYIFDGSPTLDNAQVLSNTAGWNGGGVSMYWYAAPTFTGGRVAANTVITDNGGGIAVNYESSAVMTHVDVLSNTTSDDGGGVWVNQDSALTFSGGRVQGNEAVSGSGGGLDITFQSTALISGVQVLDNRDDGFTGGIYLSYIVTPTIHNCTIASNTHYGVRIETDVEVVTITQSIVRNNGSGGVYLNDGHLDLART